MKKKAAFTAWVAETQRGLMHWLDVERHVPKPKIGVYVLSYKGAAVYVGQSRDVDKRVAKHKTMRVFNFDNVEVIPCAEHELLTKEAMYIKELTPAFNVVRPCVEQESQ